MIKRCHRDNGSGCPDIVAAFVRADSVFLSLLSSLSAGSDNDTDDSPRLLFPLFASSARTRLDTSKAYG
jgi:hypothetical protein